MRTVKYLLAVVAVAGLQLLGLELVPSFSLAFDLLLVLAVFVSLAAGPVRGMLAGSVAGLAQDALTGGPFGLHGFADTFIAWLAGRLRHRIVIQQPLQVGLLFALAAGFQQALLVLLQYVMVPGSEPPKPGAVALRIATTGIAGLVAFAVNDWLRRRVRRWRRSRRQRLSLELE